MSVLTVAQAISAISRYLRSSPRGRLQTYDHSGDDRPKSQQFSDTAGSSRNQTSHVVSKEDIRVFPQKTLNYIPEPTFVWRLVRPWETEQLEET